MLKSIELFAGAGGLGMGASMAGISPRAVVERDKWACDTLEENKDRGFPLVKDWPLYRADVRNLDFASFKDDIDLLLAGPPCQPFSIGGKHTGERDSRDMFCATASILRVVKPRAFIIENVRGLTRPAFANYYQYILNQLEMPDLPAKEGEDWIMHFCRLEREKSAALYRGLRYETLPRILNAADYGAPQKRERVFIVGFRADEHIEWNFPSATHSADQLIRDKWITGEYWDRHEIPKQSRPRPPETLRSRINNLRQSNVLGGDHRRPWRTVRDTLATLPEPSVSGESDIFLNHRFQPGARRYKGHTGSPMDDPAKALKAGDHGVPGGENMVVRDGGTVRYFTIREAARLQTFPDGYVFHGAWSETMRQLGNAVPVTLAHRLAASVAEKLLEARMARMAGSGSTFDE